MNLLCPNTSGPYSIWRASEFQFPFLSLNGTRDRYAVKNSSGCSSRFLRARLRCGDGSGIAVVGQESSDLGNNGGSDFPVGECVEVLVVGSRKDAVLDFCAASPFFSPTLRFWNIIGYETDQVRLQLMFTGQDTAPTIIEDLSAWQSSCKAVILVASAAYGLDHIIALEALRNAKSDNGFAVGIILKPFRFEGQRRQNEVKDLVDRLHKQTNFCIVLDTDVLLENDMVTLDEASRTSHNAVLMAMNAISILLSAKHVKLLNARDNSTRELHLPDIRKIFESYSDARIGLGAGHSVKTSLLRAINECPFLGIDIKDCDGSILCLVASSGDVERSDANISHTVRLITKFRGDIIVSIVHEPNLESKTILVTLVVFGCTGQKPAPTPRNGILSSLGQHFPFIFNMFRKQTGNSENAFLPASPQVSNVINSSVAENIPDINSIDDASEDNGIFSSKVQQSVGSTDEFNSLSSEESDLESPETSDSPSSYALNYSETYMLKRELLTRGNLNPSHLTEQSKNVASFSEATGAVDTISIYRLPVGVKNFEKFEDNSLTSNCKDGTIRKVDDNEKKQHSSVPSLPWPSLIDAENSNSNKVNGTNNSKKKQGVLSVRALSMLESERDSQKKWNRVVEMKYRGGVYRGRAQGGLPEGKGRLLLGDGSIYDGMWRYGKRSGLGTFYFNNGDVFQGSWRDDAMHGKGWIYFHTGDRWFVNFWKGKANGEGRFYSKHGYVFFGHFKEGWRHGQFLRINVDGTRIEELWNEGVLVSERQMDNNPPAES